MLTRSPRGQGRTEGRGGGMRRRRRRNGEKGGRRKEDGPRGRGRERYRYHVSPGEALAATAGFAPASQSEHAPGKVWAVGGWRRRRRRRSCLSRPRWPHATPGLCSSCFMPPSCRFFTKKALLYICTSERLACSIAVARNWRLRANPHGRFEVSWLLGALLVAATAGRGSENWEGRNARPPVAGGRDEAGAA